MRETAERRPALHILRMHVARHQTSRRTRLEAGWGNGHFSGARASSNFAATVGLPLVSRLMVRSSALSLARRRLFADLCSASLVFSRSLMASSMRLMASSNPSDARRALRPKLALNVVSSAVGLPQCAAA